MEYQLSTRMALRRLWRTWSAWRQQRFVVQWAAASTERELDGALKKTGGVLNERPAERSPARRGRVGPTGRVVWEPDVSTECRVLS
jgi:hypothetical protein